MEDEGVHFYSIRAAAKKLGIHYHTLLRMCKQGVVRTVPVGKRMKIPKEEFERILREGVGVGRES